MYVWVVRENMQMLYTESRLPLLDGDRRVARELHLEAIERVIRTMRARVCAPVDTSLSLEDMADIACLSPYYFSRVFHQIIGIPPGEFLATLRLEAAKRLLLTTSLSVTDICFEVGYTGLGSFTTRFTQMVGVSPRQLRHLANTTTSPVPEENGCFAIEQLPEPPVLSITGLRGHIHTPHAFNGFIFAGLFPKPIPQGQPAACTQLCAPGPYHIDPVPDGVYYLLVAALPASKDVQQSLLLGDVSFVGAQGPLLIQHGRAQRSVDIMLRPHRVTDPPIIMALLGRP
jgi:AraC family transcriptional regulator